MVKTKTEEILEKLKQESPNDYSLVIALKNNNFVIGEACSAIGMSRQWWAAKPRDERDRLMALAKELDLAPLELAMAEAEAISHLAVLVFKELLSSPSKEFRLRAAKEISRIVGLYAPEKRQVSADLNVTRFNELLEQAYGSDSDDA